MLRAPIILAIATWAFASPGLAQTDSLLQRYVSCITQQELKAHLQVLASDAYKGRDTGKEGQKMAAAYLKKNFQEMGIPPVPAPYSKTMVEGYFQPYELIEELPGGLRIVTGGKEYDLRSGLVYFNVVMSGDEDVRELIYLRNGATIPDGLDLAGKAVLIDGTDMGGGDGMMVALRKRLEVVRKKKPMLILVSSPDIGSMEAMLHDGSHMRLADGESKTAGPSSGQMVVMDQNAVNGMLGRNNLQKLARKKVGRRVPVQFSVKLSPKEGHVTAENVLAYIEGSDKKDEVLVITAHYDHIGVEHGVVYNGADDDGTGTVALLEIAQAFAKAKAEGHGPRRSVLVMPVSGEEKGLLGSHYYSDHPIFPLANTVADLNIDMIGRTDSAHMKSPPYVYVIGSDRLSSELHAVNEAANKAAGLVLDYTFNAESDPNRFYYRSDHYNFARKGVPSIFYFSGVHEDYHQPTDDVEKIQFDLLQQRAQLVFRTAWELANREQRIVVDKPVK